MKDVYIDIWYGDEQTTATNGLCQRWVNILGRVSPPQRVQHLQYRVNDGSWQALSIGPDYRRLAGHGDFNLEIDYDDLKVGANSVLIRADIHDGQSTARQVQIYNEGQTTRALPATLQWTADSSLLLQAQITDGLWHVQDRWLWVKETGYDRAVAVGSQHLTSYEVRVPVTLYGFSSGGSAPMSGGYGLGIAIHWQGHVDWGSDAYASGQPRHGYQPIGGMLWYGWDRQYGFRLRLEGHDASTALGLDDSGFQMRLGQDYMLSLRVQNQENKPCRYALKAWHIDELEPDNWLIEADGAPGELESGSALLLAHHVLCRFGTVEIRPVEDS